jgi:DNA gyrase/topoisomerase IV subunit A
MDPRRVNAMIKADLKYLKDKFGDDRRTRIIRPRRRRSILRI